MQDKNLNHPKPPESKISCLPQNSISTYTVLHVLIRMKRQLGIEAMIEYTEKYLEIVDQHNPRLKMAVKKALEMISVERIYEDAMANKREGEYL